MTMDLARNWWAIALRGALAVLFGIAAFAWPGETLGALVLLFGAYALVDGAFAVASAFLAADRGRRWWPFALEGLTGIAAGAIALIWPGTTALALVFLIGAWAVLTGAFEIAAAIRLRREIDNEWLLVLSGVLSVLFGVLLFALPGVGALALVWLLGAYAVAFGVLLLTLGFRLRSWRPSATRDAGRSGPIVDEAAGLTHPTGRAA